jgi:hypothetical protein
MDNPSGYVATLKKRIQQGHEKNDIELILSAEQGDKDLLERIENYRNNKMTPAEREANSADSILERIKTDQLIRAMFRKDPTRQSIHEKTQIEFIQKKHPDAVKMSANVNGVCLYKGKLHTITKANPRPSGATKTFDVNIPSKHQLSVLKHTDCAGGAQDNQYEDVSKFIKEANLYLTENPGAQETFAAYLDGPYYTPKKITALEEFISSQNKQRIFITSCASLV